MMSSFYQGIATLYPAKHPLKLNSPSNIILDDVADLEKSVRGGAGHCFLNSGQSCNAPTKMLVSENGGKTSKFS